MGGILKLNGEKMIDMTDWSILHLITRLTRGKIPTYYIVCSNHHYLRQYRPAPLIVGFHADLEAREKDKPVLSSDSDL